MLFFSKLLRNQRGSVAAVFAIGGLVLAVVFAASIELALINSGKAKLQNAVDAATLEAAKLEDNVDNDKRTLIAKHIFNANLAGFENKADGSEVLTPDYSQYPIVKMTGEIAINTFLPLGIFDARHKISATSSATRAIKDSSAECVETPIPTDVVPQNSSPSQDTNGFCVLAKSPLVRDGIIFNSGAVIDAPQCNFNSRSIGSRSVVWNMNASVKIANLFAAGDILNNASKMPNFYDNVPDKVSADPYATGLPQPIGTVCEYHGNTYSGATTIKPGTYCGSHNFMSNGAKVKLLPGLYIVKNGSWIFDASNVEATEGVTIFFEDDSDWKFNNKTSVNLEAPKTGAYTGIAFYEKYGLNNMTRPMDAPGGFRVDGLVYFPSKDMYFNAGNNLTSANMRLVANTIIFDQINWKIGTSGKKSILKSVNETDNLIKNGSFESAVISNNSAVKGAKIEYWESDNQTELHNSAEWVNSGGYGSDGVQYSKLNGNLYQNVELVKSETYNFSFDYHYSDNGSNDENKFQILVDGVIIGTLTPNANRKWERVSIKFKAGNVLNRVEFKQINGTSNGALLDNVKISKVNDQNDSEAASQCVFNNSGTSRTLHLVK